MSQPFIITTTSGSYQDRLKLVPQTFKLQSKFAPDNLTFEDSSSTIGIDQARTIKQFFATTPITKPHKTVIIFFAQNLTRESQNSLLKILEEPPTFAQIALITQNLHQLLPTVISRCQVVSTSSPSQSYPDTTQQLLAEISNSNSGQRINLSNSHNKDSHQCQTLTREIIDHLRFKLKSSPNHTNLYNLTMAVYTHKLLKQNTNPKLCLDQLFLKLK